MIKRIRMTRSAAPLGSDRKGWAKWYIEKFNKNQTTDLETLAIWYLFLSELDD